MKKAKLTANVNVQLISGTDEERGIKKWREYGQSETGDDRSDDMYHLPLIQTYLDKVGFFRFLPFCPRFSLNCFSGR